MMSSFEQALPPRERLELTVNDLFMRAELFDGVTVERTPGEGWTREVLTMMREKDTIVVCRTLDEQNTPDTYIVGAYDSTQLSEGIAGLGWCPSDSVPPRLFDTKISYDTHEEVTGLLPDWLQAQAARLDAESMPPNPFNLAYEAQEVTVGTLNGEGLSDERQQRIQLLGAAAVHHETLKVLLDPIMPPIEHLFPEQ
jgi:hypothetical protein